MSGIPHHRTVLARRAARILVRTVIAPITACRDWLAGHAVVLLLLAGGVLVALGCTAVVAEVYESVEEDGDLATAFTDLGGTIGFPIVAVLLLGRIAVLVRRWEPVLLGVVALPVGLAMSTVGTAVVDASDRHARASRGCFSATTGSLTSPPGGRSGSAGQRPS